ncbi:hypothetical protein [Acidovorax sp. NCPPB 4044]|uniref:hypothetical protein n=1 Tax=Acidovorax sp. NCPPB 4044 TaxID=2940490 RepID=UPI002304C17C|nr:hypothetical protein [Acidovorax sp. NCPPB 4044]MDA8521040.1 hypothetical protein [Acidovorax sp. NCPPB 4044]
MTSNFQELQAKAIAWCKDFEQYKDECVVFAQRLRVEFIAHLGARSGDVEFHALDERLERITDERSSLWPKLQVGDDGFFYFGLTLFFRADSHCLDEHVRVGIQKSRSHWRVRWNQKESTYSPSGPNAAFFDKVTAVTLEKFATPFRRMKGQLGFVPTLQSDHHLVASAPPSPVQGASATPDSGET